MNKSILLVGAGPMAIEYGKVLNALDVDYVVAGRGYKSAELFEKKLRHEVLINGLSQLDEDGLFPSFDKAIVCVTEHLLGSVTRDLIVKGVKNILVEKPGGLSVNDIRVVGDFADKFKTKVYVGYNRRYYASVEEARAIIETDGGVTSFNFEFTEWSHVIEPLEKAEGIKEGWFLANSSHVVDLAFYLGGKPKIINCFTSGGLSWHPSASIFSGAGVSESGALFSYGANWEAPGRWGVEMLTKKHRLYLRPMEKLQIQDVGKITMDEVPLNDQLDLKFKPGLYKQTENFLKENTEKLVTIEEQCAMLGVYKKIGNLE